MRQEATFFNFHSSKHQLNTKPNTNTTQHNQCHNTCSKSLHDRYNSGQLTQSAYLTQRTNKQTKATEMEHRVGLLRVCYLWHIFYGHCPSRLSILCWAIFKLLLCIFLAAHCAQSGCTLCTVWLGCWFAKMCRAHRELVWPAGALHQCAPVQCSVQCAPVCAPVQCSVHLCNAVCTCAM